MAQAGLFAVGVALARLLGPWGVTPERWRVIRSGEVAAAYVAGVLSLEDACAVVAARGRLMQALPGGGAMCAVAAGEDRVREVLAAVRGAVVAAVNGPAAVVISGERRRWRGWRGAGGGGGRGCRRLRVSHAFHSPLMDPMLAGFAEVAGSVACREPAGPGGVGADRGLAAGLSRGTGCGSAGAGAVRGRGGGAAAAGARTFVEVGPDAVLSALAGQVPAGGDAGDGWLAVLRRGRGEARTAVAALAGLHVRGVRRWTGPGSMPGPGRRGWTCRRTRSSGSGTGWPAGPAGAGMRPGWARWRRGIRCWGRRWRCRRPGGWC